MDKLKLLAIIITIIVILNIIFFAMGLISQLTFWIIILLAALIAYLVVPKLREML